MYNVSSTNMQVASKYENIGDEEIQTYLVGQVNKKNGVRYIADLMKYPESAWTINVPIPDKETLYGPFSGQSLSVLTYLTFPSSKNQALNEYSFPYQDNAYGSFNNMLAADEKPSFADPKQRYPLIILAHGLSAHGIYDIQHAQSLASQGYIVAVIFYGDDRNIIQDGEIHHLGFLRPLLTKSVLDSILDSKTFGANIDTSNIGISGHSFGGFTALALAGAKIQSNSHSVADPRIKAGVIAAPWVGGKFNGKDVFAFGHQNIELKNVSTPIICLFGSDDESTLASFILPAAKQLSGPRYVIELVGQEHIFEPSSWQDRDNWESLFFSAYLKNEQGSFSKLKSLRSITGGSQDKQLFDYQNVL